MSNVITSESLLLNPDSIIEMFEVDTGKQLILLCNEGTVSLGNKTYLAFPIASTGFEYDGKGSMPRPRISIASDPSVISLIDNPSGFVGAKFTRIRTFRKFLNDGTSPDANAIFPKDEYIIDKKVAHTSSHLEFELCAVIDQEGKRIPARQIIRDTCPFVYRRYNSTTGDFDYTSNMQCPYTGTDYYTKNGTPTIKQNDKCGKRISDCQLRYATDEKGIPFGGFPGVGRIAR